MPLSSHGGSDIAVMSRIGSTLSLEWHNLDFTPMIHSREGVRLLLRPRASLASKRVA